MAVVVLLSACGLLSPPSVPDEIAESVAGEQVTIVAKERANNPTDEWVYTYLMLEVGGTESGADTVASVLEDNGWAVDNREFMDILLRADLPEAHLVLVDLATFLDPRPYTIPEQRFAEVPTSDDKTYYVAIISPKDPA